MIITSRPPVAPLVRPPDEPLDMAPTPDGNHIIMTVGHDALGRHPRQVYSVDSDGQNLKNLTPGIRVYQDAAASPDGKRIAFVEHDRNSQTTYIHLMDMDGANNVNITPSHSSFWAPRWSPDSSKLVVTSFSPRTSESGIALLSADGSERKSLIHSPTVRFAHACFTQDGSRIVFESDMGGNHFEIHSMQVDGSDLRAHTPGQEVDDVFSLSPHGHIAYSAVSGGDGSGELKVGVYTTSLSGNSTPVRIEDKFALSPRYSPDGSHLAYLLSTSVDNSRFELIECKADGSDKRSIAAAAGLPTYMPDGKSILYAADVSDEGGPSAIFRATL